MNRTCRPILARRGPNCVHPVGGSAPPAPGDDQCGRHRRQVWTAIRICPPGGHDELPTGGHGRGEPSVGQMTDVGRNSTSMTCSKPVHELATTEQFLAVLDASSEHRFTEVIHRRHWRVCSS